jgi:recombination protein RecT
MNQVATATPPTLAQELDQRTEQFAAVLPSHISVDRFKSVVVTAVNNNQKLLSADRRSFFNACVKAAQDGLLPDNREGALIIYTSNVKDKAGNWQKLDMVQWQRMVFGVRKQIRNSGQVSDIFADVVREGDVFEAYRTDEKVHYKHEKNHWKRGKTLGAYSFVRFLDGSCEYETMSVEEMWEVWKKSSKAKDKDGKPTGMWKDHTDEAFKKTVLHRHAKQLPLTNELMNIAARVDDDDVVDVDAVTHQQVPARPQRSDYSLIDQSGEPERVIEESTGEIALAEPAPDPRSVAFEIGQSAESDTSKSINSYPDEYKGNKVLIDAFQDGFREAQRAKREPT